ncbi:DUF1330 domain-containing protein [Acetobacter persici]|uniref:DUF1330 domain-containing protein n=1 Tax=Acetobacter persici TaxID=1076596 RepID=UPI0020CBDF07|nr:DUF1330 domain-containing protein [Acetobacter persici]MCP9319139.1 DUF1330 domain-containing protein [Acetobacter persici]
MSAYVVFTRESTQNSAELETYMNTVAPTFEGHPVKFLALYGKLDFLEGSGPEGIVILEFPTMEAARAWYDSPSYQAVAAHRHNGATYRVTIVDGQPPAAG